MQNIETLINSKRKSENILFNIHFLYEKIGDYNNAEKYVQKLFNWTSEELKKRILFFYIYGNKMANLYKGE